MRWLAYVSGLGLLFLWPQVSVSKESLVTLATPKINFQDKESIKRGADHFKKNCMSCHSLKYTLTNPLVREAGMTKDTMPVWPKDSWGGHPPPDLSNEALLMSPNWIYTYLMTYYEDPNHSTGFNNLVYPNTSMPNPFAAMQGKQVLKDPNSFDPKQLGKDKPYWYRVIQLEKQGRMSADEFETYIKDIVNFMHYIADPSLDQRVDNRLWIMGYLLAFSVLLYWIYKEFTKPEKS